MNWTVILLLGLGTVLGLTLSANAVDTPFAVHGMIFAAAAVLAIFAVIKREFDRKGRDETGYNDAIVRTGVVTSMFWGLVGEWC